MATNKTAERDAKRRRQAYEREIKRLERATAQTRPWFAHDKGARLEHDRALLSNSPFSELVYEVRERDVILAGFIPIVSGASGITHRIAAEVRFSSDYPRSEPAAYDQAKRFKALPGRTLPDRHLGSGGWCCLWLPSRSEWQQTDPEALIHFLRQLAVFFERQLIYDVIKRWPGPEYAHGDAGYVQDICESLREPAIIYCYERLLRGIAKPRRRGPCVCGSDADYLMCHKPIFDQLGRRMPQRVLDDIRRGIIVLSPSSNL